MCYLKKVSTMRRERTERTETDAIGNRLSGVRAKSKSYIMVHVKEETLRHRPTSMVNVQSEEEGLSSTKEDTSD